MGQARKENHTCLDVHRLLRQCGSQNTNYHSRINRFNFICYWNSQAFAWLFLFMINLRSH